jgi:hypothetical protein
MTICHFPLSLGQAPSLASVHLTWLERLSWDKHSSLLSLFNSDKEKQFYKFNNCLSMSQLLKNKLDRFPCQAFPAWSNKPTQVKDLRTFISLPSSSLGQAPSLASIHLTRLGRLTSNKHTTLSSLFDSDGEKKFYGIDNCKSMSQL